MNSHSSSPSITQQSGQQTPTFARGFELLAELGPETLIANILEDWFSYLHPLSPILHRRRFLSRVKHGEANTNPVFLALLISTCAATIALLSPRAPREYGGIAVTKCLHIIEENDLLRPDIYSLDWCIAHYNIASALMTKSKLTDMRLFRTLTNASTGVQWLIGYGSASAPLYDREILKRLYGLLLVWQLYVYTLFSEGM